jgi:hypothetical protein
VGTSPFALLPTEPMLLDMPCRSSKKSCGSRSAPQQQAGQPPYHALQSD